jgi:hypothetical protein
MTTGQATAIIVLLSVILGMIAVPWLLGTYDEIAFRIRKWRARRRK